MVKCSFCGRQALQSRLLIYVNAAGQALNFCSRKCKDNMLMGRDNKKVKWVTKHEKSNQAQPAQEAKAEEK